MIALLFVLQKKKSSTNLFKIEKREKKAFKYVRLCTCQIKNLTNQ